jgi:flagellar hook assembly protein FlgD
VAFTVQVDPGVEANSVLRNNGHATSTSASTVDAFTDTKIRGDVQVTVAVYNEAGEVVKSFPVKYLSKVVDSLDLSSNGLLSNVGDSVTMTWGGGRVLGTWDGTSNNGQLVANGTYYVKVDSVDAYGTTTSVTKSLSVGRAVSKVGLTVFNQAGEAVRHLTQTYSGPIDNITEARLTASVISPTNGKSEGVTTTSVMSGNALLGTWDGRNDGGQIVNNGQYYIELKVEDGKGDHSTVELTVSVLASRDGGQTAVVRPNVLTKDHPVGTIDGGVTGGTVNVKVYSLTGSLVETLNGTPGSGTAQLNGAALSSGMYILVGEVKKADGTVSQNFRTKVMVVR